MPRNGSGTMSVTNSFSPNTTISSSAINANYSDIATELTNSLPRDGQAAMSGQFKAATGSAAAPSISFGSDTDSGLYRKSANTIGVAVGGVEVATITSASGGGVMDALPSGTVMLFVQTAAPTGWTKSTTHNDKALRIVSGTASSGGTTSFVNVLSDRWVFEANLPAHAHTGSGSTGAESAAHTHAWSGTTSSGGAHTHTFQGFRGSSFSGGSIGYGTDSNGAAITGTTASDGSHVHTVSGTTGAHSASHTHAYSFTTSSVGSGTAMDFNIQYVDCIIAIKD